MAHNDGATEVFLCLYNGRSSSELSCWTRGTDPGGLSGEGQRPSPLRPGGSGPLRVVVERWPQLPSIGDGNLDPEPLAEYCRLLGGQALPGESRIGRAIAGCDDPAPAVRTCGGADLPVCQEHGYNKVALGHHHDDAVETFLEHPYWADPHLHSQSYWTGPGSPSSGPWSTCGSGRSKRPANFCRLPR